jgi:ATP-binding cassette subfamily B protein
MPVLLNDKEKLNFRKRRIYMQQMGYKGSRYYHEETEEKPHITKALVFRMLTYFSPYWKLMSGMVLTIIITSILV